MQILKTWSSNFAQEKKKHFYAFESHKTYQLVIAGQVFVDLLYGESFHSNDKDE